MSQQQISGYCDISYIYHGKKEYCTYKYLLAKVSERKYSLIKNYNDIFSNKEHEVYKIINNTISNLKEIENRCYNFITQIGTHYYINIMDRIFGLDIKTLFTLNIKYISDIGLEDYTKLNIEILYDNKINKFYLKIDHNIIDIYVYKYSSPTFDHGLLVNKLKYNLDDNYISLNASKINRTVDIIYNYIIELIIRYTRINLNKEIIENTNIYSNLINIICEYDHNKLKDNEVYNTVMYYDGNIDDEKRKHILDISTDFHF